MTTDLKEIERLMLHAEAGSVATRSSARSLFGRPISAESDGASWRRGMVERLQMLRQRDPSCDERLQASYTTSGRRSTS